MLRRSSTLFILVVLCGVLFAGCGQFNNFGGNVLKDETAIKNVVKEMKKQAGTPLVFFRDISISNNFISFSRQDPRNLEKVDSFIWSTESGWQPPRKVVLLDEEKEFLNDLIFRVDDVKWEALPVFVANAEKKAKEEGIKEGKIYTVTVHWDVAKGRLSFETSVVGKGNNAFVTGEVITGGVTKIEIKEGLFN